MDDILDVSRIITGQLRFDAEPTDLRARRLGAPSTPSAPRPRPRASRSARRTSPGVGPVMGEPRRSATGRLEPSAQRRQVHAHRRRGARARRTRDGAHARVTVTDTGAGIRADFLPYVFDRFRQGDQSTTRTHGGLGLGLSIVRHLVELHGGTVRAESEGEGRGSTFTVELPSVAERGRRDRSVERTSGESAVRNQQSEILEGLRVLVVDDEQDALDLLKTVLGEEGGEGDGGRVGRRRHAALEASWPDLLLCDIGMPGEDGYQLMRRVRELESSRASASTPAVALTAYAGEADRALALDAGYQLHVPKPVDPAALVSMIADLVGRQK
jgi:CheY-like chemotaxis protein